MKLSVVILAAGQGTRMRSKLPKVLHEIAGKTMLERVVKAAKGLDPEQINIVYGHQGEMVRETLQHLDVNWVEQTEQLGTGHAVLQAIDAIPKDHRVFILCGDTPLILSSTLEDLIHSTPADGVGLITARPEDPKQLGRIMRDHSGNFTGIVEYKDATSEQRQVGEVNSGLYLIPAKYLHEWLPKLTNKNAQQEYYLTDILEKAVKNGIHVVTVNPSNVEEVLGVNDRIQQAQLERYFQKVQAKKLMLSGVTLKDPQRIDIRGRATVAKDVILDVNVVLEGKVTIGTGSVIGPNVYLKNSIIGANVVVKENSSIEGSTVGDQCVIGPFARLRPGSILKEGAKVGNFVETKNATLHAGCKVNHLSYVGDATVGEKSNIGAGTITCNYDGVNKHRTEIGNDAFIGSGSQLVAPVKVGDGAFVGAGSTITKDVPAEQLTLARAKQKTIESWQAPKKEKS